MKKSSFKPMNNPEYEVTIYPLTLAPWLTQVYSGLYNLEKSGLIRISISADSQLFELVDGTSLPIRVKSRRSAKEFSLLVDLNDNRNFAHPALLSKFDVIAKRSYLDSYLSRLPDEERTKIIPYGVNFCCGSVAVPIVKLFNTHHRTRLAQKVPFSQKTANLKLQHQARFLLYLFNGNLSLLEDDFTKERDRATHNSIFFLTRLFGSSKELAPFSVERIQLVRSLKANFGERFFGGIVDSDLSRAHCDPSLLFSKLSRRDFIAAMNGSRVVICTLGVGDSTPWKLGESLAGGRCVLSEPLRFALPKELADGQDYKTFSSTESCIASCDTLLSNANHASEIGHAASSYYDKHVRSERLIENLLRAADEHHTQRKTGSLPH